MANYRYVINPHTGKLQKVLSDAYINSIVSGLNFKEGVDTVGDLPSFGNTEHDARITNDTHHLYVWNGSSWIDQGDIFDIAASVVENDSAVTGTNVKEALDNLDSDKLEDAPSDGKTYGRKDASWEEVTGGGVMSHYVTVGTSGANYDNFDDAIDYLRTLNGGRIIVITDMVITSTAVKDISHIQIEGCNFYSGTIKISKTANGGYWYGKNIYIKDIQFNRIADTGANEIYRFTEDYQDVVLEWVSCIGFGAPFNSPKVFNINGFESHILTKGNCLLGAQAANWHPFLNPLKLVLHIYDRTSFYGASDTFDACFMTDSTLIEGTPTFITPDHPVRVNKASGMDNDSSVTGDTVKDALNNCLEKNGINGTFTTTDGKTITVVDGQITNIV